MTRRFLSVLATAVFCAALPTFADAAPASSLPGDVTNGGRALTSLSDVDLPSGATLGSVGGAELPAVSHVDPERYLGTWYQVAAIPQPFNLQCVRSTTATYSDAGPGRIAVRNECDTPWGARSGISGTAVLRDAATAASYRVFFPGVPGPGEAGPTNYRITYLAEDYSLAIVGDPQRLSGFVLSRTPALTPEQWSTVRRVIGERGWWDCAFLTSPVSGGLGTTVPLCTLPEAKARK